MAVYKIVKASQRLTLGPKSLKSLIISNTTAEALDARKAARDEEKARADNLASVYQFFGAETPMSPASLKSYELREMLRLRRLACDKFAERALTDIEGWKLVRLYSKHKEDLMAALWWDDKEPRDVVVEQKDQKYFAFGQELPNSQLSGRKRTAPFAKSFCKRRLMSKDCPMASASDLQYGLEMAMSQDGKKATAPDAEAEASRKDTPVDDMDTQPAQDDEPTVAPTDDMDAEPTKDNEPIGTPEPDDMDSEPTQEEAPAPQDMDSEPTHEDTPTNALKPDNMDAELTTEDKPTGTSSLDKDMEVDASEQTTPSDLGRDTDLDDRNQASTPAAPSISAHGSDNVDMTEDTNPHAATPASGTNQNASNAFSRKNFLAIPLKVSGAIYQPATSAPSKLSNAHNAFARENSLASTSSVASTPRRKAASSATIGTGFNRNNAFERKNFLAVGRSSKVQTPQHNTEQDSLPAGHGNEDMLAALAGTPGRFPNSTIAGSHQNTATSSTGQGAIARTTAITSLTDDDDLPDLEEYERLENEAFGTPASGGRQGTSGTSSTHASRSSSAPNDAHRSDCQRGTDDDTDDDSNFPDYDSESEGESDDTQADSSGSTAADAQTGTQSGLDSFKSVRKALDNIWLGKEGKTSPYEQTEFLFRDLGQKMAANGESGDDSGYESLSSSRNSNTNDNGSSTDINEDDSGLTMPSDAKLSTKSISDALEAVEKGTDGRASHRTQQGQTGYGSSTGTIGDASDAASELKALQQPSSLTPQEREDFDDLFGPQPSADDSERAEPESEEDDTGDLDTVPDRDVPTVGPDDDALAKLQAMDSHVVCRVFDDWVDDVEAYTMHLVAYERAIENDDQRASKDFKINADDFELYVREPHYGSLAIKELTAHIVIMSEYAEASGKGWDQLPSGESWALKSQVLDRVGKAVDLVARMHTTYHGEDACDYLLATKSAILSARQSLRHRCRK